MDGPIHYESPIILGYKELQKCVKPKGYLGNAILRKIVLLSTLYFVTGCASTIESFYNRQVVQDQLHAEEGADHKEIGTLAVTAQRRLIVANLKSGNFCSEPPPEAADSVGAAIAAALKANISADRDVNAELASNFARHVNHLYKRAHTVQLFRDATYHLCVNAVNSANGKGASYESYKSEVTKMVTDILPVLDNEVKYYYEVEKARAQNSSDTVESTVVYNSSAEIEKGSEKGGGSLSTSIDSQVTSENDNEGRDDS